MPVYIGTRRVLLGAPGIRWLLRDEFTDTRSAGNVNGTPATPGPGTRVAVETKGQFTVGSGVLNFPEQAPSSVWGGLGLYYNLPTTRTAGRVLVWTLNVDVINQTVLAGFCDRAAAVWSATYNDHWLGVRGTAQTLEIGNLGALLFSVGTPVAATTYQMSIVLRSAGAYFLVKGGTFTNWTLLYVIASGNTATLYPVVTNHDNSGRIDYFRIPDALWLPPQLCSDQFTRANGPLGSSEIVGPDSQAVTARAWTDNVGTWAIAGNVATCSALAGGLGFATVDTSTINVVMQGTLTRAGNEVGLILRYVDADNYIRLIHDGTNMKLIKRVATVETDVISAVVAIGAGAIVVVADGTSFSLYLNDVQVGATSTIADAALQTGTRQGLFTTNIGNTLDAFLVMPRGTGNEFSALDKWSS